jgi:hypothetical protein
MPASCFIAECEIRAHSGAFLTAAAAAAEAAEAAVQRGVRSSVRPFGGAQAAGECEPLLGMGAVLIQLKTQRIKLNGVGRQPEPARGAPLFPLHG